MKKKVNLMLDKCPMCQTPLINGKDSRQYITDEPVWEDVNGEKRAYVQVYYDRPRLCPNKGNEDTFTNKDGEQPLHPPCVNYHGGDTANPKVIVETIKMIDN
jgi:hypothetical protein